MKLSLDPISLKKLSTASVTRSGGGGGGGGEIVSGARDHINGPLAPLHEPGYQAGPAVHMRNFNSFNDLRFQPVTVHMGNFSSVSEVNNARPFKFHPGNRAGVFIWNNF